jgi:hypothetical protein
MKRWTERRLRVIWKCIWRRTDREIGIEKEREKGDGTGTGTKSEAIGRLSR